MQKREKGKISWGEDMGQVEENGRKGGRKGEERGKERGRASVSICLCLFY